MTTTNVFSLVIIIPGIFLIGKWVGSRSDGGFALSMIMIGSSIMFDHVTAALLGYYNYTVLEHTQIPVWAVILAPVVGSLFYIAVVALGWLAGQRKRAAFYLNYLFSVLPEDSRSALLSLAEEEVINRRATHQT